MDRKMVYDTIGTRKITYSL